MDSRNKTYTLLTAAILGAFSGGLSAQQLAKETTKGNKISGSIPDTTKAGAAQTSNTPKPLQPLLLPIARQSIRLSYPLEASYGKTTHIIFPSKILYVDLGSDGIIADKADPTENVLRIKANKMGFDQTTLTIITEDGKYYPFVVNYNDHPQLLNISIAGNQQLDQQQAQDLGILTAGSMEDIALNERTLPVEQLKDLSSKVLNRKRFIKDVGVMKMKMSFLLTGAYVYEKTLFLQITMENRSDIDYHVDFFKFFLKDRDVTKRMAFQEDEINSFNQHPNSNKVIPHQGNLTLVFALPMVTYGEDKMLEVLLYESKGGRHLRFEIDSDVIIRAKSL